MGVDTIHDVAGPQYKLMFAYLEPRFESVNTTLDQACLPRKRGCMLPMDSERLRGYGGKARRDDSRTMSCSSGRIRDATVLKTKPVSSASIDL